jgi:hypothetical protein
VIQAALIVQRIWIWLSDRPGNWLYPALPTDKDSGYWLLMEKERQRLRVFSLAG